MPPAAGRGASPPRRLRALPRRTGEFLYLEDDAGRVAATVAGRAAWLRSRRARAHDPQRVSARRSALVVFSPGVAMERFTRAAGVLAARGEPQIGEVMSLAAQHGIELTRGLEEVS